MAKRTNRVVWGLAAILALAVAPCRAGTNGTEGDYAGTPVDYLDRTPLMLAALNNETECVKAFLAEGAEVNAGDRHRMTALMWATPEMVPFLIQSGASVRARDDQGRAALHYAAFEGYASAVSILVNSGALVNAVDHTGLTPLHWAVGSVQLSFGLDHRWPDSQTIREDLQRARSGREVKATEVVSALLDAGADPNVRDQRGQPPLLRCLEDCDLLVRLTNVIPDARPFRGSDGIRLIVKELLAKGADVNAQDREGHTALIWAVSWPDIGLVELLLQHRVDVGVLRRATQMALSIKPVWRRGYRARQEEQEARDQVKALLLKAESKEKIEKLQPPS